MTIWLCTYTDAASSSIEVIEMDSLENDFGEPCVFGVHHCRDVFGRAFWQGDGGFLEVDAGGGILDFKKREREREESKGGRAMCHLPNRKSLFGKQNRRAEAG